MSPQRDSWVRTIWLQLPLVIGLIILWVFLWDAVTVMTIVTGLLLALGVMRVFYLPPVLLSGRVNLLWLLYLAIRMIADIVVASIGIALLSINPRYHPLNSVIAVRLHTRSDLVMTLTAEAISVVPGTVVIDVDREEGILYLHAINTPNASDIETTRRRVLGTEERIVLAIGTHDQAETVRAERRERRAELSRGGTS
ncbi:Na+/H+ antiporter subunit E [Agromyces atrinae]|uniref:Multicomponent Na+:H+ antiporter subunit E n=1 Tax=Agromyces atrinae TaxID=592376 RepID=A0A4Q2M6H0_9MICO|nr:Na+/H+ antiporter subunit E [Agromyces atrinae]NYD66935.1 multicomponent Na+:H+ antiporter subunit E [Agromyces atrinae]RXZ87579.1 Na+/H+ antiporter subunit E [Agromyces atrinae]